MATPGNLLTTALAVRPQTDVECAPEKTLSLDVQFWLGLDLEIVLMDIYTNAEIFEPMRRRSGPLKKEADLSGELCRLQWNPC